MFTESHRNGILHDQKGECYNEINKIVATEGEIYECQCPSNQSAVG